MPGTIPTWRFAFLFLALAVFAPAGPARAGHPLGTEDAETRGKGNVEVEFNYEHSSIGGGGRESSLGNTDTLGLARRIDLAVSFAHLFRDPGDDRESVRGMGDTEVTLETAFRDGSVQASLASEWEGSERYIPLGEFLWEKNVGNSGSASSELLVGGKAEISRNLTLDVGIRWGTTGASPDVTFLAGITLAFSGGETPGGHPHDERETPGRGAGRQDRRQWTRCIFPTDI